MSLTLPNLLTLLRVALIPLWVAVVFDGRPGWALAIFVLAGVTDALDGFIARFCGQQSHLGEILDPAADKLLLTTAYVLLAIPEILPGPLIPAWVTALVISRDVLIVVVAAVLHRTLGISRFPPTFVSKVNTLIQIIGVALVLLANVVAGLELLTTVCIVLVVGLTVLSGLDYVNLVNRLIDETGNPHRTAWTRA